MEENNSNTETKMTDITNMTDAEFNTFMKREVAQRAAKAAKAALDAMSDRFWRPAAVKVVTRSCCGALQGEKHFEVVAIAPGHGSEDDEAAKDAFFSALAGMDVGKVIRHNGRI